MCVCVYIKYTDRVTAFAVNDRTRDMTTGQASKLYVWNRNVRHYLPA